MKRFLSPDSSGGANSSASAASPSPSAPAGAAAPSPASTAPATSTPSPAGETSAPPAGPPNATPAAKPADPLATLLDEALPDQPKLAESPQVAPPPTIDDPLAPEQPVAQPTADMAPAEVFKELELDASNLPPEAHGAVAGFLRDWYETKYAPVAARLAHEFQGVAAARDEQAAWYQQAEQLMHSQHWALANSLLSDPGLMARVQAAINGGPAAGMPDINPDELDPQARAIYEIARQGQLRAEALEQQLAQYGAHAAEVQRQLSQANAWQEQRSAQERASRFEAEAQSSQVALQDAIGHYSQKLGFDVRSRPEFKKAIEYAMEKLDAETAAAQREGRRPRVAVRELIRIGLDRAGFRGIREKRLAEAQTSPPMPNGRVPGPGRGADALSQMLDEAFAAAGK